MHQHSSGSKLEESAVCFTELPRARTNLFLGEVVILKNLRLAIPFKMDSEKNRFPWCITCTA